MKNFLEKIPVFDKNSNFILLMNTFYLFFYLINLFLVSVWLFFETNNENLDISAFEIFSLILILIEVLLFLNTSFLKEGKVKKNREEIVKNYSRKLIFADILYSAGSILFLITLNKFYLIL
jgi:uncharacterized membrane protein YbhN (UPF0104 family)